MTADEAQERLIDPENIVIGGKSSASMYEFVPPEDTLGMEGYLENQDYFEKQSKHLNIPFSIQKESVYDFPENLDAFVFPYGCFNHFVAPKRLYGKIMNIMICSI